MANPANDDGTLDALIAPFVDQPGGLLPALHAVHDAHGFISDDAIRALAEAFNLSRADVHGVVSFYHDFRRAPGGRHIVKLCQAEACQAMGGRALTAQAKRRFGIDFFETDAGGHVTLEPVYCLGNCACAPAAMIDGAVVGRVTAERFEALADDLEARRR